MVKETKAKVYADNTLANELRKRGILVKCMWEEKGPPLTEIAWITCYLVNGRVVLVETFKHGHGWNAFTACESGRIDDTIEDVIKRCNWNGDLTKAKPDETLSLGMLGPLP